MAIVTVQYVGPFDAVTIPTIGATVERGATVDVSDTVAGWVAGDWRPRTEDDPAEWPNLADGDGSPVLTDDGSVITRDPGGGLLAQSDNWRIPVEG